MVPYGPVAGAGAVSGCLDTQGGLGTLATRSSACHGYQASSHLAVGDELDSVLVAICTAGAAGRHA